MAEEIVVSVIIVNYDGYEHLEACLSSLIDLAFPKEQLEVIVVCNGSTEASVDAIKSRFPNVRLICSEVNLGFSKAANLGSISARGEYLAFLHDDMRVDRSWLRILVETARAKQGCVCVGSAVLNWDGSMVDFLGRPDDAFCLADLHHSLTAADAAAFSNAYSQALFASGGAALIQSQVFHELGGFDPDFFLYHEDVDFGWRLWLRGYNCVLASDSVVYHMGAANRGKLPEEHIQTLVQKHTLGSVFKNMDNDNLGEILPLLLYFFLERGRRVSEARSALAASVEEFQSSLNSLVTERAEVQRTRFRSDADIFALVGHPFGFLLDGNPLKSVRQQIKDRWADIAFHPDDPGSVRAAISEWLNRAHFLYESELTAELERAQAGRDESLAEISGNPHERDTSLSKRDEAMTRLQNQLAETRRVNRRIKESNEQLRDELAKNAQARQTLVSKLDEKSAEFERFATSIGGRLLNSYGRIKYRYLLPLYRMLGLHPNDTTASGNIQAVPSVSEPPLENEQPEPEPEPASEDRSIEEECIPLESDSWDALGEELVALAADEENLDKIAELLSEILPIYLEEPRAQAYFEFWQSKGFHVTPVHYYQPVPDTRDLPDELWDTRSKMAGIDMNEPVQLDLLRNAFPHYRDEWDQIPTGPTERGYDFHFNNGSLDGMDALVLYCMVRHFKPNLLLEVGGGFSSRLIARAALLNGNTRLVCIEPYPDDLLRNGFPGLHTLLPIRVQEAGFGLFQQLGANDILFIDSSHVVKCGGDVNYLFLEVLPRLRPGVIVHIHDIFLPNEFPRQLVKERHFFWTEQYLLQAFLTYNSEFEVLFANGYIAQRHHAETIATFPNSLWWGGGSFWIRRKP